MRFKEFINEASIFSRGTYSYGHKVKIAQTPKGKILATAIQKLIPEFGDNMELSWEHPSNFDLSNVVEIPIGRVDNNRFFHIPAIKKDIKLLASDSVIEAGLNHAGESKKFNRGDIAEGILGAALAAKLIRRGLDKIGMISDEDIKKVLSSAIINKNNSLTYTVNDKDSQIADMIMFSLRLNGPSLEIISDKAEWSKFQDLFLSSAHYANSADADRYSNYFYKNGKVDEVFITSDGLSGQKSRKTDVSAVVRDPQTGKVRTLKNVDISLKADSNQFGQQGTGGPKGGPVKWLESANTLFSPFGISVTAPATVDNIRGFYKEIYSQAASNLKKLLEQASVNKETAIIEKVADIITHHATLNVPNVRIVNLTKSVSSIHGFTSLKGKLIDHNINLDAELKVGPRSGLPSIVIFDKASKLTLVSIRFFSTQTGDKTAHVFEKGPLLHSLTKIEKTVPGSPNSPDK